MSSQPVGWTVAPLGEFLPLQYGKALSERERESGEVPVYGSNGVAGWHSEALVDGPCLLVGRKGAAGAVHLSKGPCWPIDTVYFTSGAVGVDLKLYALLLESLRLGGLDRSTAVPSLSRDDYSQVSAPLIPSSEQVRIRDKLDELFSDLDAGVAALHRAQANLKRYRASVLKAAVEGRLTADWRQANPPTETGAELLERLLRERRERWEAAQLAKFEANGKMPPKGWREKYVEPAAPDTSKLPALSEGWCWAAARSLCEFITKGTTPDRSQWRKRSDVDAVPFIRVTNLTDDGTLDCSDLVFVNRDAHENELARSLVVPGDVVMNIVGPPLGQVSLVPPSHPQWNMNQAVAVFRPVLGVSADFLCSYLRSSTAQAWLSKRAKTTAGQVNLTLELCRDLPVPVPPIAEQHEVVVLLETVNDSATKTRESIWSGIARGTALRQSVLKHAFTGKLVAQDPTDEPASKLLERIRAATPATPAATRSRGRTAKSGVVEGKAAVAKQPKRGRR